MTVDTRHVSRNSRKLLRILNERGYSVEYLTKDEAPPLVWRLVFRHRCGLSQEIVGRSSADVIRQLWKLPDESGVSSGDPDIRPWCRADPRRKIAERIEALALSPMIDQAEAELAHAFREIQDARSSSRWSNTVSINPDKPEVNT